MLHCLRAPEVAVSPADAFPSPGSCCVDEVAAEHVGAEAVVHYGPACLSPCRKLLVLHVFGQQPLDTERCAGAFRELYPDRQSHVVVLSDVVYAHALGESCVRGGPCVMGCHPRGAVWGPCEPLCPLNHPAGLALLTLLCW